MKRYTLRFKAGEAVAPEQVKAAVEDALLRLHPGITYRMGHAARIDPQTVFVEIGSEGKKEVLEPRLKSFESKLPVALDRIDWGWETGDSSLSPTLIQNPDLRADPLASVEAPGGMAVFPSDNKLVGLRYALFFLLTLALGTAVFFKASRERSLTWDGLFLGAYILWLFSLDGIPFDPRRLAGRIECGGSGLEVAFRFRKKPVRVRWEDLWGMDFTPYTCIIRSTPATIKFSIGEGSGFREKDTILKTISDRASLRFVEGGFRMPFYRRADAP